MPPRDGTGRPPGIPPRQQRLGLSVLLVVFVALAVGVGVLRAGVARPAPAAPAASSRYSPDPTIPAAARTTVYASGQQSSGVYEANTNALDPSTAAAKINPFTVRVETSLVTDPNAVAATVFATLNDPRGWQSYGKNGFRLVNTPAVGQLEFLLASPATVDALCGATQTKGRWDCLTGSTIVLNSDRWFFMTPTYSSLPDYRAYMVNRQVGFWLGQQPGRCRFKGAYAPVMANQNESLGVCLANPWPRLAGEKPKATGTPSATATPSR